MKIINDVRLESEMSYPVGRKIEHNFEKIKVMGKLIAKQYKGTKETLNLVCRGSSGAIVAALISNRLSKKGFTVTITHIKKEGENAHNSSFWLDRNERVIIVDDFTSTGETLREIYKKLHSVHSDVEVDALVLTGDIPEGLKLNFAPDLIICGTGGGDINYKPL